MPDPEVVREVVASWLAKAADDLEAARLLAGAAGLDPGLASFHAQQAAEKALKAILVARLIHPPRTHDLEKLRGLVVGALGHEAGLPDGVVLDGLTAFAIDGRYPLEEPMAAPDRESVAGAIAVAETVLAVSRAAVDE